MLADTFPRQRTWPTLAWTGAGAVALIAAQILGVIAYVFGIHLTHAGQFLSTYDILRNSRTILGSTVLSTAAVILFLWGLTRIRTRDVPKYLAFCWPGRREFIISMIAFILFMVLETLLSHWPETSSDMKFMQELVASARAANAIPFAAVALVLAAPVGEELAFRGFVYRTLELKFGGIAAIVVTALGWAALHVQYSLIGILVVFAGGLLLGAIRRYSGSLYLTMLMHALWNGAALAGAMLMMPKA